MANVNNNNRKNIKPFWKFVNRSVKCSKEFEVTLQHKSKLCLYRELKQEVWPEEYLEFVKGAPFRLFKISFRYRWAV